MMKLVQLCLCVCVLAPSLAFGQEAEDEARQEPSKQIQALRQELESKQAELANILQKKDKKIAEMAQKLDKAASELTKAKRKFETSHAAALQQKKLAESAAAKAMESAKRAIESKKPATEALFWAARGSYTDATKTRQAGELKRLEAELARARTVYGKAHPAAKSMEQRVRILRAYIARVREASQGAQPKSKGANGVEDDLDDAMAALKERYSTLRQAEEQLGKANSDALAKYRAQMRAELARLETQMKMVQQDQKATTKVLQEKRTAEMLEMQERLKRANDLAEREREMINFTSVRPTVSVEKRLDKLETKVDKITSLLERLVEKKARSESKDPFSDKKEDE